MKHRFSFLLIFLGVLLWTPAAISATWTDPGTSNNTFDFSATTVSESSHHPGMTGQAQY